jgi:hypothetical protein
MKTLTTLCVALLGAALAIASPAPAAAQSAELQMAEQAQPLRAAADAFIAHAMAGDAAQAAAMLSPALVQRMGEQRIERVLRSQILPFFQRGSGLGRSTTATRTTDADGHEGMAFYMWLTTRESGQPTRPFTIYVVREQGRLVVANVVPDRLMPGRHV